jgi:hypothetical protein
LVSVGRITKQGAWGSVIGAWDESLSIDGAMGCWGGTGWHGVLCKLENCERTAVIQWC